MKTSVNYYDFRNAFMARRPDNFSAEGLQVLFNHLEQCEEEDGIEMELNVIGLCCDYTEWSNYQEFQESYPDIAYDEICEHGVFIKVDDTRFITNQF